MPWRLLAYLLKIAPDISKVRTVLRKRLMDESRLLASEKQQRNERNSEKVRRV